MIEELRQPASASEARPTNRNSATADRQLLLQRWARLSEHAKTPMETLDWALACRSAFCAPDRFNVVRVETRGDLSAVAPMIAAGHGSSEHLTHAGVDQLYEPTGVLASSSEALEQLARALLAENTPLRFARLPADAPIIDAIKRAAAGRAVVIKTEEATYPYISLTDEWREPERNLSKRRQSDMRRAWRFANDFGPVSVRIFCPSVDEVDDAIELAMQVESKSWKGDQGDDMATNRPIGAFFRDYARRASLNGVFRIGFLYLADTVAAMQLSVVLADRFWVLKVGYDPAFQKASPGILLMIESIKYALSRGLVTYELLGTAADWTRVWTEQERPSVELRVYPPTVNGALGLMGKATTSLARKLLW